MTKNIDSLHKKASVAGFSEGIITCDSLDRLRGYIANMAEETIDPALSGV